MSRSKTSAAKIANSDGGAFLLEQSPRILVVEDDVTYRPFWNFIAERVDARSAVCWASSENEAEERIVESVQEGRPFDLIVSDIFLSGSKTGIDLWAKFKRQFKGQILFTSGIGFEKYEKYFSDRDERPVFLQKPLNPVDCIGAMSRALHPER